MRLATITFVAVGLVSLGFRAHGQLRGPRPGKLFRLPSVHAPSILFPGITRLFGGHPKTFRGVGIERCNRNWIIAEEVRSTRVAGKPRPNQQAELVEVYRDKQTGQPIVRAVQVAHTSTSPVYEGRRTVAYGDKTYGDKTISHSTRYASTQSALLEWANRGVKPLPGLNLNTVEFRERRMMARTPRAVKAARLVEQAVASGKPLPRSVRKLFYNGD
jgi:hypothetical protein